MRLLGLLFPLVLVLGLAFWANREHGLTKEGMERVVILEAEIARNSEMLKFLRDEWAHLNRPSRLEALVSKHFDQLKLSAVTHARFRQASIIPLRNRSASSLDSQSGLLLSAPDLTQR